MFTWQPCFLQHTPLSLNQYSLFNNVLKTTYCHGKENKEWQPEEKKHTSNCRQHLDDLYFLLRYDTLLMITLTR